MIKDFKLDEIIRLKKRHPCGSFEWRVTRLGADIGLRCSICSHYILMPRAQLERRLKGKPRAES